MVRRNGELGMPRSMKVFALCVDGNGWLVRIASIFCFWIFVALAIPHPSVAQTNVVVVRPKAVHDVLGHPGMGITTLQRVNGQQPNQPWQWSEAGPVTILPRAAAKQHFPATA